MEYSAKKLCYASDVLLAIIDDVTDISKESILFMTFGYISTSDIVLLDIVLFFNVL